MQNESEMTDTAGPTPYYCPAPGHTAGHEDYNQTQACRRAMARAASEKSRAAATHIKTAPADEPTGTSYTSTLHGPQDGPPVPNCARCGRPSRGLLISDPRGRLVHERCSDSGLS